MLRSFLHASLSCFINPSLPHLKPSNFFTTRHKIHTLSSSVKSHGSSGSMADILAILGPFDTILPPADSEFYVGLLRRCIRFKHYTMGSCIHGHLVKSGFGRELLVSNVLLDMYVKLGCLDISVQLFDEMPVRDLFTWCTLISGYVSHGFDLEAFSLFKRMCGKGLSPNHFVLSSVLKGCSGCGIPELGLLTHGFVIKSGLGFDRFVEIGIVDMYAKCGRLDDAVKSFYGIPVKCLVAWNAMISGYVHNDLYIEAVGVCHEMHQVGFLMDLVTLRVVARMGCALEMFDFCKNIHVYSIKIGLDGDSFVVAELIKLPIKYGEVAYMGELFNAVKKPDASLYSLVISGYRLHGHRAEAVKLAEELLALDSNPMQGAVVSVLSLCLLKEEGTQIHARILKTGHASYVSVCNALISMYIKFGETADATVIFVKMPQCDVVSWTAIMAGLVQNLRFGKAFETFIAFRKTGIPLDQHSAVTVINACTGLRAIDKGKQIHALALKLWTDFSGFLNASLVYFYAKCGLLGSASRLFSYTSLHDLILTNVMLAGYCWNSEPGKALELFGWEYRIGLHPDHFSLSIVLGACANMKLLVVGEQIHCLIAKSGFEFSDVIIGNAIINMYVKSGSIANACRFFYSTRSRDVTSYSMLMFGYIENKGSIEALRLFYQMQQNGVRVNPVAFARILRGCCDLSEFDLERQVHASVIKMGLVSDVCIGNELVEMYAKSRVDDRTRDIIEIPIGDEVPYDAIAFRFQMCRDKIMTLKAFGLFKLEEVKAVWKRCASADSQTHENYFVSHDVSAGILIIDDHLSCRIFDSP